MIVKHGSVVMDHITLLLSSSPSMIPN